MEGGREGGRKGGRKRGRKGGRKERKDKMTSMTFSALLDPALRLNKKI